MVPPSVAAPVQRSVSSEPSLADSLIEATAAFGLHQIRHLSAKLGCFVSVESRPEDQQAFK